MSATPASALAVQRPPDCGEVVIAVPHGVILEHELARERSVGVERHRCDARSSCSSVSARIAAAAARCSGAAGTPPSRDRPGRSRGRAPRSSRGHPPSSRPSPGRRRQSSGPAGSPADRRWRRGARRRRPCGRHRAAVLPLLVGQGAGQGGERAGAVFEAIGKRLCTSRLFNNSRRTLWLDRGIARNRSRHRLVLPITAATPSCGMSRSYGARRIDGMRERPVCLAVRPEVQRTCPGVRTACPVLRLKGPS